MSQTVKAAKTRLNFQNKVYTLELYRLPPTTGAKFLAVRAGAYGGTKR